MQQISFIFVYLEGWNWASMFRVEFSTCGAPAAGTHFPADTVSKAAHHNGTFCSAHTGYSLPCSEPPFSLSKYQLTAAWVSSDLTPQLCSVL